jgi:hypothetical protein
MARKPKNLDETWTECLRMWKWIVRQVKAGRTDIGNLKRKWRKDNGYRNIRSDCFFCEYSSKRDGNLCDNCPGKLVDKEFSCGGTDYDWSEKPLEFYKVLKKLNRKRKKREKRD